MSESPGSYAQHNKTGKRRAVPLLPMFTEPEDPDAAATQGTLKVAKEELWMAIEAQKRADRRWTLKYVVLPLVLAGLSGITGMWAAYQQGEKSRPTPATKSDVDAAVELNEEAAHRIDLVERRVQRLSDTAMEQQLQISEGFDYMSSKLDAMSPKARAVPEPVSLTAARKKADAIKRRRSPAELFDEKATEETP